MFGKKRHCVSREGQDRGTVYRREAARVGTAWVRGTAAEVWCKLRQWKLSTRQGNDGDRLGQAQ